MPRAQISITLEPEHLAAVDDMCNILDIPRTEFIENAIVRELNAKEGVIRDMEAESPITRAVLHQLSKDPRILMGIAKLFGEHMPREVAEDALKNLPVLEAEADRRKLKKKEARRAKRSS